MIIRCVGVWSPDGAAVACHPILMTDLEDLAASIRTFTDDRGWARFHDPKSLLIAMVGEVGEVAELLQWLPADDAAELVGAEPLNTKLADELSDVLIYLLQLAQACGVDLATAAPAKLAAADRKFPASEFYGRAPERT
jgi:dCTP diphosphatase